MQNSGEEDDLLSVKNDWIRENYPCGQPPITIKSENLPPSAI